MVIRVFEIAHAADTAQQGACVHAALVCGLREQDKIVVSFRGVDTATSSFVNSSFVALLDILPLPAMKGRIQVIDATKQIQAMIKLCVERASLACA